MTLMARLRRFWLDVHLWLGVGLMIPVILICISGAVLVFHEEMEPSLNPERYAITGEARLAPSAYLEAAREAAPEGFSVATLRFGEAGDPVIAQVREARRPPEGQRPQTRSIFLDPPTANVLAIANTRADFFGVMHQLHGSLMIPEIGRKVVGWIGWAMLLSTLTGLWLWWPRNGGFLRALRWRRGPRTTFNLHHMMGFWIAIPLAILSLTGVYISFPQTARALAANFIAMSPAEPRGLGAGPGGGAPLRETRTNIDAVAQAAQAALPDARLVAINLPTGAREGDAPSWRVDLDNGEPRPAQVQVDDETGQARVREEPARQPGDGLALTMRRIHDGVDQHVLWRWVVFLGGVIPVILAVTGVVMWLRRRAARAAIHRARPADDSPTEQAAEGRT